MESLAGALRYAHITNSWLILVAGCATVAVMLVETLHRKDTKRGGLVAGTFAVLVYLQVLLGVSIAMVMSSEHSALFDGNGEKALWHPALGVCAALLVTLGLWTRRRHSHLASVIIFAGALIAPNLARFIPIVLLAAACWACVELMVRRSTNGAFSDHSNAAQH